ncbi:MAG TPA: hypothetical protein VNV85_00370 [Puia sp.]|jgi:hypothetical protein|nr:hypothetical protein [Puia sp.]
MKKNLIKGLFLLAIFFTVSFTVSAQVYVKIRPPVPVIVRPPQPSHAHVWINEEWEPNGGNYRYAGGHWDAPPHPGYRWRSGHWRRHHNDGEEWVRGSWGRRY